MSPFWRNIRQRGEKNPRRPALSDLSESPVQDSHTHYASMHLHPGIKAKLKVRMEGHLVPLWLSVTLQAFLALRELTKRYEMLDARDTHWLFRSPFGDRTPVLFCFQAHKQRHDRSA